MKSPGHLFRALAAVSVLALMVLTYVDLIYLPEKKALDDHHVAIQELGNELRSLQTDRKEQDALKQRVNDLEAALSKVSPGKVALPKAGSKAPHRPPSVRGKHVGSSAQSQAKIRWREDEKCGPSNPLPDGGAAQCNPDGSFPCCSASGWCGASGEHCTCQGCVDYRSMKLQETAKAELSQYSEETNKTIALVIPFRDRGVHLERFRERMQAHVESWRSRGVGHTWVVFVVEQFDNALFNRGWLFNVGFQLSREHAKKTGTLFDCVVMQDIDLLPEDAVDYGWCIWPMQLSGEIECWSWSVPYPDNVGGVTSMSPSHWNAINGFSNEYEGWGGEDDDLYFRLKQNHLLKGTCHTWCNDAKKKLIPTVYRPSLGRGRFNCLHDGDHTPRQRAPNDAPMWSRLNAMKANSQRWRSDGISSVWYHSAGQPVWSRTCSGGCVADEDPIQRKRVFNEMWVRVSMRPISSPNRVVVKLQLPECSEASRPLTVIPAGIGELRKMLLETFGACRNSTSWVDRTNFLLVDVTKGQALLVGEDVEPVIPDSSLPSLPDSGQAVQPAPASGSKHLVQGQRLSRWIRKLPESHRAWLIVQSTPVPSLFRGFVDSGRHVPQTAPACISVVNFDSKKKYRITAGTRWCGDGGWSHSDFFLVLRSKTSVPEDRLVPICIAYNPKFYTYRFEQSEAGCVGLHEPSGTVWKHAQTVHTAQDAAGVKLCVGIMMAGEKTRWTVQKSVRCDSGGFTHSFSFRAMTDSFASPLASACILEAEANDGSKVVRRLAPPGQCQIPPPVESGLQPWKVADEVVLLHRRHAPDDVRICVAEGLPEKSATDGNELGLLWRAFHGEACTKAKFATTELGWKVHWQVQQEPELYVPHRATGKSFCLSSVVTEEPPGFYYTWVKGKCVATGGSTKELSFHAISVTDALSYVHLIDDVI